ncbi:MAG: hypothetical protein ACJA1A_000923 [Saprospiraceae bacterium]|jgi:hypothetical protein|tara:strand:- start:575 stop:880 length:306 start_codon:yes stop_codon:yes gene_type:complete
MIEKNSLFTGLIVGAIVPVLGYILVEFIFGLLAQAGLMEYVSGGGVSRRMRTLALLGICTNLIPLNICRNRKWDDTMRGIVFPTLLYVGFWIWQFGGIFFS